MKCFYCEEEPRAACQFCGRFVCHRHIRIMAFFSGFGQKIKDNLWPSGSDTGVIVDDAAWCGHCTVRYQKTH